MCSVWKMPRYMLSARECFHAIDSMATDVHTIFSFICRSGGLSMCSPRASLNESKNVYVIAGQTRWDVAAKRPKAIWMTHTKSTLLLLLLLLFTAHEHTSICLTGGICLRANLIHKTTSSSVAPDKMRLIKQNIIEKDGSGTATLLPEEPEDMVSQFVSRRCSANDGH